MVTSTHTLPSNHWPALWAGLPATITRPSFINDCKRERDKSGRQLTRNLSSRWVSDPSNSRTRRCSLTRAFLDQPFWRIGWIIVYLWSGYGLFNSPVAQVHPGHQHYHTHRD